jgi:hypothetical protein
MFLQLKDNCGYDNVIQMKKDGKFITKKAEEKERSRLSLGKIRNIVIPNRSVIFNWK